MFTNYFKLLLIAAIACSGHHVAPVARGQDAGPQFYELRIYHIESGEKQSLVSEYLEKAYLPALHRLGFKNIGVFSVAESNDEHSLFVLIPFEKLETFTNLGDALAQDAEFQQAAKTYFDRPLKDPLFQRIEGRLLKAFAGMPTMERPEFSKQKKARIFELRLYESHTEDHARRKVAMFNNGEIQLMREVGLGPVFFGETLIGSDVPNLVYLLSAESNEQHQEHWKTFLAHPTWDKLKNMEQYKDTVSRIQNWFLVPMEYSDL